jgi:ribosome-binding protein aMBF1 (putative translation factor)
LINIDYKNNIGLKMDCQDWIPVVSSRRYSKKEQIKNGQSIIQFRDSERNEKIRMAKLAESDGPSPVKRISSESLQNIIRKRIELKLTQEKADINCSFPRNTFKDIESNRLIPNEEQKRRIHQKFGIQLKFNTST